MITEQKTTHENKTKSSTLKFFFLRTHPKNISTEKLYSNPTELTAELLNTLVEKILIHETQENSFGETELVIDIIYRFVGKID